MLQKDVNQKVILVTWFIGNQESLSWNNGNDTGLLWYRQTINMKYKSFIMIYMYNSCIQWNKKMVMFFYTYTLDTVYLGD